MRYEKYNILKFSNHMERGGRAEFPCTKKIYLKVRRFDGPWIPLSQFENTD